MNDTAINTILLHRNMHEIKTFGKLLKFLYRSDTQLLISRKKLVKKYFWSDRRPKKRAKKGVYGGIKEYLTLSVYFC